jgi:hypothetical protein
VSTRARAHPFSLTRILTLNFRIRFGGDPARMLHEPLVIYGLSFSETKVILMDLI